MATRTRRGTELQDAAEVQDFGEPYVMSEHDDSQWERVTIGIGEKVEWGAGVILEGTYRGTSEVAVSAERTLTGESETATAHLFLDTEGNEVFAWSTQELDAGLEGLTGRTVRIIWLGKVEIGRGQTMNKFKIFVKKGS